MEKIPAKAPHKRFETAMDLGKLFEHVPDTQFWIKDSESRIVDCNAAFLAHFAFQDKAQIRGLTDTDISPQQLAREYMDDDRTVAATGKPMIEKLELVREANETMFWYATTKTPLRDGSGLIIGTAGFTRKLQHVTGAQGPTANMERAIRKMNSGYSENLTIPGLAQLAGMSVDNFERRFRILLRETPLKYLNRIRIRAACGLLIHTDLSVGEIARQTGFTDQSYFARRFHAHLHLRPFDYRRKYAKPGNFPLR
jgi:AraC-like DNA-binding protein